MFETLLFLAALIVGAQLWSRMRRMEERLSELELGAAAFAPAMAEPAPVRQDAAAFKTSSPVNAINAGLATEVDAPLPPFEPVMEPVAETTESPESEPAAWQGPPAPEPIDRQPDAPAFGFEELFGRRLPIWAGGVTLAVAGVLIVRYSIEAGLLSPLVRFLSGLLFGAGLIAAAETALRHEDRIRDPRVRQSLAGAGIASLYASILVAVNVYALIGPIAAFIGMAAVTALAMALSLRFGPPSALLGLVGGLAAPALVGAGQPNVPLLTLYLALAVGGLSALSRSQRWAWLGISALVGGLGWGAMLLLGGVLDTTSALSIGFYILLVGIAFPFVALPGSGGTLVRFAGGVAAAAQMAALVATGGFDLLHWGLFGLISIAILYISRHEEAFRQLPLIGLGIALLLLGAWTDPQPGRFALVLVATVTIYGGPVLVRLWRPLGSPIEAGQIASLALAASLLSAMHFYRADGSVDLALAAVALVAALFPAAAAALGWRHPDRRGDARFAALASTTALLAAIAAGFAAPTWSLPLLVGGIAVLLLLLSRAAREERIEGAGWVFAAATLPMLSTAPAFLPEADRLIGGLEPVPVGLSFLRWAGLGGVAALFAWRAHLAKARAAAQVAAVLLAYGAVAQIAPPSILPFLLAAGLLALTAAGGALAPKALHASLATLLALIAAWAGVPLLHWASVALTAVGGDPVVVGELPLVRDVLLRLLLPATLIGASLWIGRAQLAIRHRTVALTLLAALAVIGSHVLFKQLLAIDTDLAFAGLGLAERTLWEGLLASAGVAAWLLGARKVALVLCLASLAHFGLFSVILHNPLWADQAVGTVPILNLLLPSYGLALALLWAGRRFEPELSAGIERLRALLQMGLILLLAFSLLRQIAKGSMLALPGLSAAEDIARSILAVLLAIGFLLWGIRTDTRDWRIASLVLMLGAVAKVFLLDASGLEGLMRIASFVALGLRLIGIGWLYSRSLGTPPLSSLR